MTNRKRIWLKTLITLLVLIAGLPYVMIFLIRIGLSVFLFVPAFIIHNLYFYLPELLFGDTLYPSESFGYFPTFDGYVIATLLYVVIAFGLSFPVATAIVKFKQKKTKFNK